MPIDRPRKAAPKPDQTSSTVRESSADKALARLRSEFTGHRIWRSVRGDGLLGDWVASLHDPAAGVDPTVIRSEPGQLREALLTEATRATPKNVETR
ncbi:hypothetical protein [Actinomadura sp. GTD37]|uniref:hypothetical protein n=1 Tax=Actinomadura sp. GTD37 TaxID=1778030 RepID=UPI0035C0D44F